MVNNFDTNQQIGTYFLFWGKKKKKKSHLPIRAFYFLFFEKTLVVFTLVKREFWNFWSKKQQNFSRKKITPSNAVMGNCALISEKRENQRSLQMLLKYLCTTSHQGILFVSFKIWKTWWIFPKISQFYWKIKDKNYWGKKHCKLLMSSIAKFIIQYTYRNLGRRRCRKNNCILM